MILTPLVFPGQWHLHLSNVCRRQEPTIRQDYLTDRLQHQPYSSNIGKLEQTQDNIHVFISKIFYMRNLQPWQNKLVHFENTACHATMQRYSLFCKGRRLRAKPAYEIYQRHQPQSLKAHLHYGENRSKLVGFTNAKYFFQFFKTHQLSTIFTIFGLEPIAYWTPL